MNEVYPWIVQIAFGNCRNLETLRLPDEVFARTSNSAINAIKNCLQSNAAQLTNLTICDGCFFDEDFSSEIRLRLEKFQTGFKGCHHVERKNLNLFLKTQKDSIKFLAVNKWVGFDVLKTVSSMRYLTELQWSTSEIDADAIDSDIDDTDDFQFDAENLPKNNSVIRLKLSFCSRESVLVKNLLKAFPKIQDLNVLLLTDAVADIIAETCEYLETIYTQYFFLKNVSNEAFFLNLKKRICRNHSYDTRQMFERLRFERTHLIC